MKFQTLAVTAALSAALAFPAAASTLVNAGFETGDLAGWTASGGTVEVITDADDFWQVAPLGQHYVATEGVEFARLTASDSLDYTTLSQSFTLFAASLVSFDTAFLAFDSLPYDDDGYVRIFNQDTNDIVFQSSVTAVGDFGHTDWQTFSRSLGAGTYTLEAGVRNGLDVGFDSQLLLDNVAVTADGAAVPEPATWALMVLGFGGAGALLRRRREHFA